MAHLTVSSCISAVPEAKHEGRLRALEIGKERKWRINILLIRIRGHWLHSWHIFKIKNTKDIPEWNCFSSQTCTCNVDKSIEAQIPTNHQTNDNLRWSNRLSSRRDVRVWWGGASGWDPLYGIPVRTTCNRCPVNITTSFLFFHFIATTFQGENRTVPHRRLTWGTRMRVPFCPAFPSASRLRHSATGFPSQSDPL